jgi:hypothetical protein
VPRNDSYIQRLKQPISPLDSAKVKEDKIQLQKWVNFVSGFIRIYAPRGISRIGEFVALTRESLEDKAQAGNELAEDLLKGERIENMFDTL